MGYFCFRKICAAAARLAAALVLFGGSLLGGEALLAAAGGGNVAHAQQAPTNLQMAWSNTDNNMVGGTFTWTPGTYSANWRIEVRTAKFGGVVHSVPKTTGAGGSHTFADNVFTRGTRYWIRIIVEQTDGGNSRNTDINANWLAPQLVLAGAAVSINATYGHSDDFDLASVTLTWEKDSNDVIGWDIEVRDGACSGQSCTVPLITSLTVAAATRTISFPGISFSRGLPYSFRIRGKNSQRTSDWANHTLSVAFSGTPAKFTMGWSADAVTNTTFGGTLRWNFAPVDNSYGLAVYRGRCSGDECVSGNLIFDYGGGHSGVTYLFGDGGRRQVFAATTFLRGTPYTFKFVQGGVGNRATTLNYYRAPGTPVVAQAISVSLVFAGGDGFDQAATLTWQKDYNDATGWDIEVREGTCVTVNCSTSPLVTTFSNLAVSTTSQIFGVMFARGIQYSFRIRARLSAQIGDWHNNNMGSRGTPAGRSGAIDAFRMEWWPNPENPTLYGGRYRWNGPPTDNKWGLAVYPRNCTGGGPSRCQANQSETPIFDTGNVHGSAADNSSNSIRNYDFALTTFTAGQDYTFLLMQGNSPGGLHRQLAAPGGVAVAVSVSVRFGDEVPLAAATLTWEKSNSDNLSGWNVEVRQGLCTAEDCSISPLVTSFADLSASARSQVFATLFTPNTEYTFRVRGKSGSTLGLWHNANKGTSITTQPIASAASVSLVYGAGDGFETAVTLVWAKGDGVVGGWDIELRQGVCSGQTCSNSLIISLTAAAAATSHLFVAPSRFSFVGNSYRIRGRAGNNVTAWTNSALTVTPLAGADLRFRMDWSADAITNTTFGGTLRWTRGPAENRAGIAVYRGSCAGADCAAEDLINDYNDAQNGNAGDAPLAERLARAFAPTTFARGTLYTFRFVEGAAGSETETVNSYRAPGGVAEAISVSATFGSNINGNVTANLTWDKSENPNLSAWNVEVRQGLCSSSDCATLSLVASFANLPASARSQSFDALFVRGTEYSFRVQGKSGSTLGLWNNANRGFQVSVPTFATETPVLSSMVAGAHLYLVKSSVNAAYVAAFNDGTGETTFTTFSPAGVSVGGVYHVGNIQLDRYALHYVKVTVWGAHTDGVDSTLSGTSLVVTAFNSYATPPPPPPPPPAPQLPEPPSALLNVHWGTVAPAFGGITISWDPPTNSGGGSLYYEVSYGGTLTITPPANPGKQVVTLFSNLFGMAADGGNSALAVTVRARSSGAFGPESVVFVEHENGNVDNWSGADSENNMPEIIGVEPILKSHNDDQILFRVSINVDGKVKAENFRLDGFQDAGVQPNEVAESAVGNWPHLPINAFKHIILATIDTAKPGDANIGEINASQFPSGTYSVRLTYGGSQDLGDWFEFSYDSLSAPIDGDLSNLNATPDDGQLVVTGAYVGAPGDNRELTYQYIHPVGGNTINVQGVSGVRFVVDNFNPINGVAYTISARLANKAWKTAAFTLYSADAPQILAFLGDDGSDVLGTVTVTYVSGTVNNTYVFSTKTITLANTHSNVAVLRWEVNFDGAQNPRVELMHRGVAQTLAHDAGSRHYSYLVTVAKNEGHVYTLRAHSNGGSSGYATATVFLPQSIPSAPATAYASPAVGGFTVYWATPADSGGAQISHYEVVALDVVGASSTTNIGVSARVDEISGLKSYTVSGAPLGVRQCLAIRAYNSAFPTVAGPAALACAAPGAAPVAPVFKDMLDSDRFMSYSLAVLWNQDLGTIDEQNQALGGVPAASVSYLLSYTGHYGNEANNNKGSTAVVMTILGKTGVTLDGADGIKYDTPYRFTLQTRNAFGASPATVYSLAITTPAWPPIKPSKPDNFSIERISGSTVSILARWSEPSSFGGSPDDATAKDMVYRIFYYPLSGGMLQTTTLTVNNVETTYVSTMHFLATITAATEATLSISKATVDWRFYLIADNARGGTINAASVIAGSTLYPLAMANYDHYENDAEASRGLEMRNVAVGVSDLSQGAPMEGFTISWDEPQNGDGNGWPAGVAPGQPPESTTLSRWIRVIILADTVPGQTTMDPPALTYAHHDIIQQRGAGGGWGVEYTNGSALSVFQTCAAGCRNANNTGANLNLAFDYGRKYRFTLVPYVRNNISGVNYWGKATVVQVAPYIHPTEPNAGKPYNVRAEGGSITWLPLGIGTGHGNISLSHYELTEITGGTITAAPLSPGNPRKQLVFIPYKEANAGKHTVSLMSPQSNKGVFRHSQLTTPIPLRTYRYEETQMLNGREVVVTSTLFNRSRYYEVQTFFKSHIKGHVFAAQNGVVTVQYTPPLPPGEAAPDAPANLAMAFNTAAQEATISWTRPDDKGYRILDYALLYNGFAARVSGHLQEYALAMRAGASHTVQLVARNGNGVGPAASVVFASPVGAPGMPLLAAVKSRNAAISVSWEAPANNGGMPITGYIASVFGGAAAAVAGGANARSHTFAGLTNGIVYTVGIYAGNDEATGRPALVTAAPHPTRPSAPSNFAVTANGEARFSISWSAPSDTGGAAISRYLVYLDGFVVATVVSSTNAQINVDFGANGIDYNVAVAAQNARGVGARAATVATAMGSPDKPKNLVAAGGAGKAIFYWEPANNAGSELLGYSITYADSGGSAMAVSVAPAAVGYTLNGIENGVYTYTIFAFNAIGNGEVAVAANVTSQAGPPFRPAVGAATPGTDQIAITWGNTDNNGAEINAFVLYNGDTAVITITDNTATTYTFTDLTVRGQSHTLGVAAQNSHGVGVRLNYVATPLGKPGAPQNVVIVSAEYPTVVFTWEEGETYNDDILHYVVINGDARTMLNATVRRHQHIVSTVGSQFYTLYAVNNSGDGDPVSVYVNVLAVAPKAPSLLRAQPEGNDISINWAAPTDNGGADITGYIVYVDGVAVQSVAANVTSYLLTADETGTMSLEYGETYSIQVAALNNAGEGAKALELGSLLSEPGAPRNLVATPGFRQIVLTWNAASPNGATINAYLRNGSPIPNLEATADSFTLTISNLTTGTEYAYTLRARNSVGLGVVAVVTATPIPGVPQNLMVESILNSVSLSWEAAADNSNDPNITYEVYANNTQTPVAANLTELTQLFTVGMHGVTVGSTSTVGVAARNAGGRSSIALIAVTVYGAPAAPQVSITGANGKAILNLTAPTDTGGLTLTGYDIVYGIVAEAARATVSYGVSAVITITGLTNEMEYTFIVSAKNSLGATAAVTANATPKSGAPLEPKDFRAAITDMTGEIRITWEVDQEIANGSPINGFIAYLNGTATMTLANDANAHTFTMLTRGRTYTVGVAATNGSTVNMGVGLTAQVTASPLGAPGAPQNAAVVDSGFPTITFTWGDSEPYNGSGLRYVIVDSGGVTLAANAVSGHQLTVDAVGEHAFTLYAVNNVNIKGDETAVTANVVAIAPKAPDLDPPQPSETVGGIDINWTPTNNGGADIIHYIIYVNSVSVHQTADGNATHYHLDMDETGMTLEYGRRYTIEVAARNSVGEGDKARAIGGLLSEPGAPQSFMAAVGDGQLTLSWSAAISNGATVTNYVLKRVMPTEGNLQNLGTNSFSHTVRNLSNGTEYVYELYAVNSVGIGATAKVTASPGTNPGAPGNLRANLAGGVMATVTWDAPSDDGGRAIQRYELRYGAVAEPIVWMTITISGGNATVTTISGLDASLNYRFELRAKSDDFDYGAPATFETNDTTPAAPGNLMLSSSDSGMVTISWTPPNNGGRILTGYNLRYIAASLAATAAAGSWMSATATAAATMTEISVTPSVNYSFSLQAVNGIGGGAWVGGESDGNQVAELDQAILPVAAAALSRQWSQAINQRLSQVGALGGGGLQANALGASFGKGQMERGVAELLRKHGGALANGQKLDGDALRNLTFSLGGGSGAGAGATGGGMGAGYSKLLNGGGIWGGASYTNMENKKGETPWEGDNIAYYAGIDRAMDSERRLLAGVMFAHNRLETNYTKSADNSRGVYNLRATGAHPYLLWRSPDNASRLWATFGYGAGEVESAAANQAKTTRDAKIYSASGGLRRNLWSNAKGAELDGQADFAVANIEVDNPGEANAKADSKNFRALLEARNHFKTTNGGVASPFMRAGFRHQSDDIDSKSGWEFSAGWRWNAKGGGWNGEVSGGAAGLSGGYKEWNANAMLRKNDTGGKGLWLTLRPQYGINGGNPVAATGDLWRAMTSTNTNANANDRAASLSLDVGYGLFGASALWRPFVGATVGDNAGEYRAGAKWEHRLRADMGMSAGVSAKRKPAAADQMQINFAVTY